MLSAIIIISLPVRSIVLPNISNLTVPSSFIAILVTLSSSPLCVITFISVLFFKAGPDDHPGLCYGI